MSKPFNKVAISSLAALALALPAAAAAQVDTQTGEEKTQEIPPPTIDTNGDGKMDAWDRDANGVPDAWDTDGDGKPDALDNDGDGRPDEPVPAPPTEEPEPPAESR
ncbi:MAG: hypothetical protein V3V15_03960 [Sphingorhabdus sp.]